MIELEFRDGNRVYVLGFKKLDSSTQIQ